jgi:hypothetical protein
MLEIVSIALFVWGMVLVLMLFVLPAVSPTEDVDAGCDAEAPLRARERIRAMSRFL